MRKKSKVQVSAAEIARVEIERLPSDRRHPETRFYVAYYEGFSWSFYVTPRGRLVFGTKTPRAIPEYHFRVLYAAIAAKHREVLAGQRQAAAYERGNPPD